MLENLREDRKCQCVDRVPPSLESSRVSGELLYQISTPASRSRPVGFKSQVYSNWTGVQLAFTVRSLQLQLQRRADDWIPEGGNVSPSRIIVCDGTIARERPS